MLNPLRRLPFQALKTSNRLDQFLFRLLPECGDVKSAKDELRWMREHIEDQHRSAVHHDAQERQSLLALETQLEDYVSRRSRGEPLQYILGSQPFGELEIKCKPGVLIPRPETETYTTKLAKTILELQKSHGHRHDQRQPLKIADYCTGSGCIALLLHSLLRPKSVTESNLYKPLNIVGLDKSQIALSLAEENKEQNLKNHSLHPLAESEVTFKYLDVLEFGTYLQQRIPALIGGWQSQYWKTLPIKDSIREIYRRLATAGTSYIEATRAECAQEDIIIANPPYIAPNEFCQGGSVSRSVRAYEPRLALVPPELPRELTTGMPETLVSHTQADQFYPALVNIALASRTKLLLMEVGDSKQAQRVRDLVAKSMDDVFGFQLAEQAASVETWLDDGRVKHGYAPFCDEQEATQRAVLVVFGNPNSLAGDLLGSEN